MVSFLTCSWLEWFVEWHNQFANLHLTSKLVKSQLVKSFKRKSIFNGQAKFQLKSLKGFQSQFQRTNEKFNFFSARLVSKNKFSRRIFVTFVSERNHRWKAKQHFAQPYPRFPGMDPDLSNPNLFSCLRLQIFFFISQNSWNGELDAQVVRNTETVDALASAIPCGKKNF